MGKVVIRKVGDSFYDTKVLEINATVCVCVTNGKGFSFTDENLSEKKDPPMSQLRVLLGELHVHKWMARKYVMKIPNSTVLAEFLKSQPKTFPSQKIGDDGPSNHSETGTLF